MKVWCVVQTAKYYTKESAGKGANAGTRTVRHRIHFGQQYDLTAEQVKYLDDKVSKTKPASVKEAEEAEENKVEAGAAENKSGE